MGSTAADNVVVVLASPEPDHSEEVTNDDLVATLYAHTEPVPATAHVDVTTRGDDAFGI